MVDRGRGLVTDAAACGDEAQREVGLEAIGHRAVALVEACRSKRAGAIDAEIAGHYVLDVAGGVVREAELEIAHEPSPQLRFVEMRRRLAGLQHLTTTAQIPSSVHAASVRLDESRRRDDVVVEKQYALVRRFAQRGVHRARDRRCVEADHADRAGALPRLEPAATSGGCARV